MISAPAGNALSSARRWHALAGHPTAPTATCRGAFVPDLITKIDEYLAAHNTEPKPHLVLGGFSRRLCSYPAIELFEGFRELR